MKKKIVSIRHILLGALVAVLSLAPRSALAIWTPGQPLVPCDGTAVDPCTFASLIELSDNVITFLVVYITVPLAAIAFAYAGFLYLTAGGSETQIGKAHSVFGSVAKGLLFVLLAFLIVRLIVTSLLSDSVNQYLDTYFFN